MSEVRAGAHTAERYHEKALPRSWVRRVLDRQQKKMYAHYERLLPPDPSHRVLDLGASGAVTQPHQYFFIHHYPYKEQVVVAGLESGENFEPLYPMSRWVQLSRESSLPFDDNTFDVVFSNAVIEHVGSRARQGEFLAEALRIGRRVFITTPNRWYPVEVHTVLPLIHWLPTPTYRRLMRALGFDFFSWEENLNLLDRRSLLGLLPSSAEGKIHYHRFLGLRSNLILVVSA